MPLHTALALVQLVQLCMRCSSLVLPHAIPRTVLTRGGRPHVSLYNVTFGVGTDEIAVYNYWGAVMNTPFMQMSILSQFFYSTGWVC